ncbi:MAG TPA: methyl-accepting chemotaxis protein, partial [Accumulibacter sp.]|nr:methyl-accepting chemotaxis protein [Accumulibacter sp.]
INAVAENTTKLSVAAKDADHAAGEGGETMRQTIDQLRRVGVRVEETATSITSLSKASAEISSIVRTIREVADQTNLLALNAAIEAARAGEQGRGFAVVADEVRKLAERTALATQDISGKIVAIQEATHLAGEQMRASVEQVASGMSRADEANSAVDRIKCGVAAVESEVAAISATLKEQAAVSNEIAGRVENVARLSENNSCSAQQSARLSVDLAALAGRLRTSAERYRV